MAQSGARPRSLKEKVPAEDGKSTKKLSRAEASSRSGVSRIAESGTTRNATSKAKQEPTASPRANNTRKHKKQPISVEMGIKSMETVDEDTIIQTVEILKRPGQTLGFYIREGNGFDRWDGVFISRIAAGSMVENNGLLHVADEILTVNSVDVTRMSLDDVVILMSIPKKLVLTVRSRKTCCKNASCPSLCTIELEEPPPVVVLKKGRSSSATAVEMTEKCPDEFILASSEAKSYYAKPPEYIMQRFDDSKRPKSKGPPPAYKLLAQVDRPICDDSGDSGLSSDNSGFSKTGEGAHPPHHHAVPSHYQPVPADRLLEDVHDGTHSKRSSPHGTLKDSAKRSPKLSPRDPVVSFQSPAMGRRHSPYVHLDYSSDAEVKYLSDGSNMSRISPQRTYDPESVREFQEEIARTHYKYEGYAKQKYHKPQRTVSPEKYNSDSEIVNVYRSRDKPSPSRENHIAHLLEDEDRSNSLPQIETGESSEELKHWLKKFGNLSFELQDEPLTGATALGKGSPLYGVEQSAAAGTSPSSSTTDADRMSYTSEEYWSWVNSHSSPPSTIQRRDPHHHAPPVGRKPRITRKLSADSLMEYRTYQMTDPADTSHDQRQAMYSQALGARGYGRAPPMPSGGGVYATTSRQGLDVDSMHLPPSSARTRDLPLSRKPLQIRTEEFKPYQPDMVDKKAKFDKSLDGVLAVHIYCGHGLKSSRTMLRDLYCVIETDGVNKARTMIRTGAINFDWDETFDVELDSSREISFLIYSWDPNTRHRLCFSSTMGLIAFLQQHGSTHKIALKLEPKGILYLELYYREPSVTLQRMPSIRKNAVFGVYLETIIKRDKSGINVPVLIQKCISEVEARGLDNVGIYRLCGSARRKVQLKEEFERNPATVDLSSDNVSDVNVITGVLKDFLRELPEPLFTNALYQMLLDALSVRLPGDPDGSAKLMLSILECLPKANQETLIYLMDHLKRVALKSDVNKMTTQNLAVCFGPVLLCPSPQCTTDTRHAMDFRKHIEVLKYLLDIWPENRDTIVTDAGDQFQCIDGAKVTQSPPCEETEISQEARFGIASSQQAPWEKDEVSSC